MKYIVVTGGVVSGLGKGVTISSIGRLLQSAGLTVTAIKIDPYLNVDAGTMSPYEHGEVFVLDDGGESDLDLGNYERFLGVQLTTDHNITTGKVYRQVIVEERKGAFLGKTVQVVPHVTDAIQNWLERVAHVPTSPDGTTVADVCLIEVGGTVGDIESAVFLEALRQFQFRVGHENFVLCFVSLVPTLSGEQKTKPTQHGVRDLRSLGLSPSIIFCRSAHPLHAATRDKISNFCHVPADHVLSVNDVSNVYHVPALLEAQGLHTILSKALLANNNASTADALTSTSKNAMLVPDLQDWKRMAHAVDGYTETVTIALIGKYTGLQDSYLSVVKALRHAAISVQHKLEILWMEASDLEESNEDADKKQAAWEQLRAADGVVVPGGFGIRGWEGKLLAAEYCRTHQKPLLGICLGFQAMVVEYARNVMGLEQADSTECNADTPHPVVFFMPEIDPTTMGGTMRLGSRTTTFLESGAASKTQRLYGGHQTIQERHRHRYEVNPAYTEQIHAAGLSLIGRDEDRMEIAELLGDSGTDVHPYYVGTQFHPEFKSRPLHPSPPFRGLLLAATGQLDAYLASNSSADGAAATSG